MFIYLQEGEIMVYVIPYDRFARDDISYFLAKALRGNWLMRFGDDNEELDAFKQCIFIGRKRAAKKNDTYFNDTLPYIDQAKINGNFVFL